MVTSVASIDSHNEVISFTHTPFHCVAFYYTPLPVGHGWKGDYEKIIDIFCKSALRVGITPIHIHPPGTKPLCKEHFQCLPHNNTLVFDREIAYSMFLAAHSDPVIICDPDQIFVKPIPTMNNKYMARLVYRSGDAAAFNGPRFLTQRARILSNYTVDNMEYMSKRFQEWDGDSSALVNAVHKTLYYMPNTIEFAHPNFYISRPSMNAPDGAYMYHFKGRNGKDEMLQYAKNARID